jgi:polar amino acid transport system substrate-binding protein
MNKVLILLIITFSMLTAEKSIADKLDNVLAVNKVRCGIVLDFPPMGFIDNKGTAVGMDVDMCKDLAKAMGIEYEIIGVTWAERIPAIVSNKVDIAIASSSDTLERAQFVGFTIPYMKFRYQALLSKDTTVNSWGDMKNLHIGASVGTTYESLFLDYKKAYWKDSIGLYSSLKSENATLEAISKGEVESIILSDTAVRHAVNSGKWNGVKAGPIAPFGEDIVGMMTLRKEYGWIRYLNLFINRQARSGRYQELYQKWIGGKAPDTTTPDIYY